jgi:type IV pilus assembly protein PilC
MARFRFVAMDAKGGETEGVLDAENQSEAISMIRSKGLFPTKVLEIGSGGQRKAPAQAQVKRADGEKKSGLGSLTMPRLWRARVKPKSLMVFTRQLATLVQAGLPLLRGLRILLKQEKNSALREALSGMGEAVEGGSTFSEALAQYPNIFDKLFVNMIKAGEAGGVLDVVLVRLAEFMEKAERLKNKVKSAMVYPIVVLIFAIGITSFLMISVIPKFKAIFDDLLEGKGGLPALTQFVINVSNVIQHGWPYIIAVIIIMWIAVKMIRRTDGGRFYFDKVKLKLPLFGQLTIKTAVARFARTLGTLMTSGVPVLQALNIVRDTSGNEVVARAIQQVHDSVKEGDNMSMPLEASGVFPGMVVSMVDVGEETGALPEMLTRIADTYEDEVDRTVEALTSIIEPIMIIFLAVIVGTIVIAMFVPMIKIIGDLSQ